jgi:hypothetical protein
MSTSSFFYTQTFERTEYFYFNGTSGGAVAQLPTAPKVIAYRFFELMIIAHYSKIPAYANEWHPFEFYL